jgi:hypothetical protein
MLVSRENQMDENDGKDEYWVFLDHVKQEWQKLEPA